MRSLSILTLGLCGCLQTPSQPPARAPEPVGAPEPAITPAPAAAPEPAAEVVTQPVAGAKTVELVPPPRVTPTAVGPTLTNPDPLWSLSPREVALQIETEPTFAGMVVGDPFEPYGRVPTITMYRDGTVLFSEYADGRAALYTYRMDEGQAESHLAAINRLGFARIPSHGSQCIKQDGEEACAADGSYVVLRARTPAGKLRRIRNYSGWSQNHQAALDQIYEHIEKLGADPPGATATRLYLPRMATLFVRALTAPSQRDSERLARAQAWPLAPELFDRLYAEKTTVIAIDASQAQALITVTGTNMPRVVGLRHGDRGVLVTMIPWMPGVDHTRAMKQAR